MSFLTIDKIVRNVIVRRQESSLRRYQTYLQLAIDGYKFLNINGGNGNIVKTTKLKMLPNKAANLPIDYVDYLKIGMCIGGKILVLGWDPSTCLDENFNECGDPLEVAIDNINNVNYPFWQYGLPFSGYYQNNQFVESMFGVGGGFNSKGYYKINPEKNQIQFNSTVPNVEMVLEYVSDGVSPDGSMVIPPVANEYLLSWVFWKLAEHESKTTASEREYWRNETMVHFKNCKHFSSAFTIDEYLQSFRSNLSQLPKR